MIKVKDGTGNTHRRVNLQDILELSQFFKDILIFFYIDVYGVGRVGRGWERSNKGSVTGPGQ